MMNMLGKKKRPGLSASRYGKRKKSGSVGKIGALTALPLLAVVGGGYGLMEYSRIERIGADYCYVREDQRHDVVFVDNTSTRDASDAQYRDLHTAHMKAYDAAGPNTRLSLLTTASDINGSLPVPFYSACRPPANQIEQASIGAPSTTDLRLANLAGKARLAFEKKVKELIADAANPDKTAGDSPILEQIQAISRDTAFQSPGRRITIITDGIQNSEIARFCAVQGDMPRFEKFKGSKQYQHVKPQSFAGADINLLLLEFGELPAPSLPFCTNDELRAWWPDYFRGNGADSVVLTRLRYWADAS